VIVARRFARRCRAAKTAAGIEAGLEFTIDLIAVVLGSGGTVHQALQVVARWGPEAVRVHVVSVLERVEHGALVADALDAASPDLGPAFHPLIGTLNAAERDGAPVAITLQQLAEEAELARRWRAEAVARRAPVAMLAPTLLCLLPAVVLGAVVPLIIVSFRQLTG
jgi:tight adherence protein C